MRTLIAPPCTLEPLVVAHASEMFSVLSDPAIYEFENEPPASVEWLAARYERLQSRRSPGGRETWLNWVVRLSDGTLAGYVQSTVHRDAGMAYVAYELNSRHWRQGIGSAAMRAMLDELRTAYCVQTCVAVLKASNHRSLAFLHSLGFQLGDDEQQGLHRDGPDELVMVMAPSAPDSEHQPLRAESP